MPLSPPPPVRHFLPTPPPRAHPMRSFLDGPTPEERRMIRRIIEGAGYRSAKKK